MGLIWERIKVTLSCGCTPNPQGFDWNAFAPVDEWLCVKHGKSTIKRMSRVTQK